MRAENILITLKEENEKVWKGGLVDGNLDAGNVVAFFKVDPEPKYGDPRSLWIVEDKPKGEKGATYGNVYFSETKNGHFKLNCRKFKIPGTKLCFPVTGFLNYDELTNKQMVDLKLDDWYLKSEHAKKYEYCLEDNDEELEF